MRHFFKCADRINTEYAAEIRVKMVQNCLKPTTLSRSTGVLTHGWCYSVGNQTVTVYSPVIDTGRYFLLNLFYSRFEHSYLGYLYHFTPCVYRLLPSVL